MQPATVRDVPEPPLPVPDENNLCQLPHVAHTRL
jgi:hypothetical protein